MKRTTSVVLGALLWSAVLAVMIAGVLFNRNVERDAVHATHAARASEPPVPVRGAADVQVAPPCPSAAQARTTVEKEC